MGLFDEVFVPDECLSAFGVKGGIFQTKSLSNPYLNHYRIAPDGRLEVWTDENQQWADVAYHGDVHLTRYRDGNWEEYTARFTEGRLARLTKGECKEV